MKQEGNYVIKGFGIGWDGAVKDRTVFESGGSLGSLIHPSFADLTDILTSRR